MDRRRIARIDRKLEEAYGPVEPPAAPPPPLDMLLLTVLSQNTNDRNRDRAWAEVRRAFPTYEAMAKAPLRSLRRAVRPAGLMDAKARTMRRVLAWTRETFGRYSLEGLRSWPTHRILGELTALKGVGVKTAHVVLNLALDRDVLPIDTHCLRLLRRLGVLPEKTTLERAHALMQGRVPAGRARPFHLHLIRHGREVCRARSPACAGCVLARLCPWRRA